MYRYNKYNILKICGCDINKLYIYGYNTAIYIYIQFVYVYDVYTYLYIKKKTWNIYSAYMCIFKYIYMNM